MRILMSMLLVAGLLTLLEYAVELVQWVSAQRRDSRRRRKYRRIRDTYYRLYSVAADEFSRQYYYEVFTRADREVKGGVRNADDELRDSGAVPAGQEQA